MIVLQRVKDLGPGPFRRLVTGFLSSYAGKQPLNITESYISNPLSLIPQHFNSLRYLLCVRLTPSLSNLSHGFWPNEFCIPVLRFPMMSSILSQRTHLSRPIVGENTIARDCCIVPFSLTIPRILYH